MKESEIDEYIHYSMTTFSHITGKHVVGGGALCTELLLKQCWSPGYTIESVIVQIAALLVKGDARIAFNSLTKVRIKNRILRF